MSDKLEEKIQNRIAELKEQISLHIHAGAMQKVPQGLSPQALMFVEPLKIELRSLERILEQAK